MELRYDSRSKCFYCNSTFEERHIPSSADFLWDSKKKRWWTKHPEKAQTLSQYADTNTLRMLQVITERKDIWDSPMSAEERELILRALKQVAGVCDGAHKLDDQGFNKSDSVMANSLARQNYLTDFQAKRAKDILRKYWKQIDQNLYDAIYLKEKRALQS